MSINKFVIGGFTEDKDLLNAVKKVRAKGFKLHDVYTPFAVHGLDEAMGLTDTSLHIAGFIYGLLGTTTALVGMSWVFMVSWPLNIGGKPHFGLPAFIPIMFELTVLFSAVGMTLTFCWLNQIMPGVKKHVFHPRQTDDLFVMAIELTANVNAGEVKDFLKNLEAIDIEEQTAETGWWFGNFAVKADYLKASEEEEKILESGVQ